MVYSNIKPECLMLDYRKQDLYVGTLHALPRQFHVRVRIRGTFEVSATPPRMVGPEPLEATPFHARHRRASSPVSVNPICKIIVCRETMSVQCPMQGGLLQFCASICCYVKIRIFVILSINHIYPSI